MYRFRSVENLLREHGELEKQAVYFAPPEELNGPEQGRLGVVWRGDINAWRSLLSHYLLCLFHSAKAGGTAIPVFAGEARLEEGESGAFKKAEVSFFVQKIVAELIHVLAAKKAPVGRDEMLFYLKCIHNTAAGVAAEALELDAKQLQETTAGFETVYLETIEGLVSPKWFAACFLTNCSGHAVWERYGQDHRGVCLKFRDKAIYGRSILPLTWRNEDETDDEAEEEPVYFNHTLRPVAYTDEPPALNFFDAAGPLPLPDGAAQWYSGGEGADDGADAGFNEWMKNFWRHFEQSVTSKTADWADDNEHRIVLSEHFLEEHSEKGRTFTYAFDDLEAVIFGAQTPDLVRVEIIEIIERKCNEAGRSGFDFYQAKIVPGQPQVELVKLDLVQSMVEW